jgi:hemerythrin-like domain-containing protein
MSAFIPRPAFDLIALLLGEHAAILSLMAQIERRMSAMSLSELKEAGRSLAALLMAHAIEEDQLLFHSLTPEHAGVRETLDAMFAEHDEQRRLLEEVQASARRAAAISVLKKTVELTREHFAVEERVLFGLAATVLSREQRAQLGAEFARRRMLCKSST